MPRRGLHRARRSPPARRSASRRLCVLRPLRGVLRGLLRGYYEATTRLLRGYYEATTRLLRGYYEATTWLLRGYYETTTRPLPGYYEATTRLLPGAARAPLGQQHSSGSTARLPAPLVLAARSRRRRSAHRTEDLEEAVLHVQLKSAKSGGRARHTRWCSQPSCRLFLFFSLSSRDKIR